MAKDIGRLRELETTQAHTRISHLEAEKQARLEKETVQKIREQARTRKEQSEEEAQKVFQKIRGSILPPGEESPIQHLPPPPSSFQKIFIRFFFIFLFLFILVNVAIFGYWYFFIRAESFEPPPFLPPEQQVSQPQPEPAPEPAPQPAPSPQPEPQPAPEPPVATLSNLIQPLHTSTLQFAAPNELPGLLDLVSREQTQRGFTEVILRKKPDGQTIRSTEFFALFGASAPASLTGQFQEDFLFFQYTYERGPRPGFITKVRDATAAVQALAQWEPQMEQNLQPLFPVWGTAGTWFSHTFRSRTHAGVDIRLQTHSLADTGIVYAVVQDYLIFSTSYEATKAAIDKLASPAALLSESQTLAVLEEKDSPEASTTLPLDVLVGQTLLIGFEGTVLTPQLEYLIEYVHPGGVLLLARNLKNEAQLRNLAADLQAASFRHSSLPLLIAVDQEGGLVSRVSFAKEKTAQADIRTSEAAYRIGTERGEELEALGINLNLSPVLDQAKPEDFIYERTFQQERSREAQLATSLLEGQAQAGILSALKHFPGYGSIPFDPEDKLAVVPDFPDISAFRAALQAQPEFLLLSNAVYPGVNPDKPFSFSEEGISLIRSELGFEGIVLSDDLFQRSLFDNYALEGIILLPFLAGADMVILSNEDYAQRAHDILLDEVKTNPQLRETVVSSAEKILKLKQDFFFLP